MSREEDEKLLFPSFAFPAECFPEAATSGTYARFFVSSLPRPSVLLRKLELMAMCSCLSFVWLVVVLQVASRRRLGSGGGGR